MQTFVAELDGTPVIAFQAKNKVEARAFLERDSIKQELKAMEQGGRRLWASASRLRIRAANAAERQRLAMAMLAFGLMAKRIDVNFWVSLLSTNI
ncbi:MAG: hypothetical protein Kow0032_16740 [Methyloligellaceae bacterium]|nr:MAG: hypothetical protein D6773_18315 [Alphaproteobacteria bacterium]